MRTGKTNDHGHEGSAPGSDCRRAVEFLPWLISGTLEESKRSEVAEHLASCESCRLETRDAIWLAQIGIEEHLPTEVLVGQALDLEVDGWTLSQIESHLAVCSECRSEFDLVASDPTLVDVPRRRMGVPGAGGRIRRWGLAAAAAVVIGSMALIQFAPAENTSEVQSSEPLSSEPAESPSAMPDPNDLFRDGFESGTNAEWTDPNDSDDSGDASS